MLCGLSHHKFHLPDTISYMGSGLGRTVVLGPLPLPASPACASPIGGGGVFSFDTWCGHETSFGQKYEQERPRAASNCGPSET